MLFVGFLSNLTHLKPSTEGSSHFHPNNITLERQDLPTSWTRNLGSLVSQHIHSYDIHHQSRRWQHQAWPG